jgi:hypothetical protein
VHTPSCGLPYLIRALQFGVVVLANTGCFDIAGTCGNTVVSESPSPDSALRAVVFERNCGATTAFTTHVSVLENGVTLPDSVGNVFVADEYRIQTAARWSSPGTIEIRHDSRARVFKSEPAIGNVRVVYVVDSTRK